MALGAAGCGPSRADDLALVGAKIYPSPSEPAIENGAIVVHDGRIVAVGPSAAVKVPHDAKVIDCKGLVVTCWVLEQSRTYPFAELAPRRKTVVRKTAHFTA